MLKFLETLLVLQLGKQKLRDTIGEHGGGRCPTPRLMHCTVFFLLSPTSDASIANFLLLCIYFG